MTDDRKPAVERRPNQIFSIVAAVGFVIWAIAAPGPITILFAVLWVAIAFFSIWRLTHDCEPKIGRAHV